MTCGSGVKVALLGSLKPVPKMRWYSAAGETSDGLRLPPPRPDSELTFNVQAPLGSFLEAVESLPLPAVQANAPFPKAADGKVDAGMVRSAFQEG